MRLDGLKTERRNRVSTDLDRLKALEIATLMNREDAKVIRAIRAVLPAIAKAIDLVHDSLARGGRLIYVGSGTSGRIGALDASECPPTFDTDPEMIQYMISGGERALANATEASEDSSELGTKDMKSRRPGKKDVVVGLAASGRTPYTIAALKYAKTKGAATIAIACNPGSELAKVSQVAIEVEVGPEVLTGSTRLKAGTAEKLICNMLTTGAMARLGYVYGNLMVNLHLKNEKLIERGISIVQSVAKVDRSVAISTLEAADMKVSHALVMLCAKVSKTEAIRRLKRAHGNIREAIQGASIRP
ncbi:MAG TPA: N-acetylmuramic acid 6-phosphate etherase [Candidatus Saccharimonadales bacterium]|nr:N-acetylmuramic acid 6-phosphate etherase [Candidatus Saccharimonadales bacterium]